MNELMRAAVTPHAFVAEAYPGSIGNCGAREVCTLQPSASRTAAQVIGGQSTQATLLHPDPSVVESYRAAFERHGRSPLALGWTKDKQDIRYKALCRDIRNEDELPTVLDYGCGLGDLSRHLGNRALYTGVDVIASMVESNRVTRGVNIGRCFRYIESAEDVTEVYDHIVCCGVFTRMGERPNAVHWMHLQAVMRHLFSRCRVALHVDFLTEPTMGTGEPGNWHMGMGALLAFAGVHLSERFSYDRSYLPFEHCLHVYRQDDVERPRNIFHHPV